MLHLRKVFLGVMLLALLAPVPASAQGGPDTTGHLLPMLAFVPDTPDNRQWVAYGDIATWYTAWDVPRVDSLDAVDALDAQDRAAWLYTLSEQTTPPQALGLQFLMREADAQREALGFNFFDVERGLEAGQPPDMVTALALDVDPAQIDRALTASGYTAGTLGTAGTLYRIRDDYEIDISASLRAAQLGHLNRIGLVDSVTLVGSATAIIESAFQAAAGDIPSLADDPAYRAAAGVVESDPALDETGPLVGVILLPPDVLLVGSGRTTGENPPSDQPGTLPPFTLAAFATRHTLPGEDPLPNGHGATSLVLALVLAPGADADAAAQTLAGRLDGYVSLVTGAPLSDRWILAQSFGTEAEGLPVAVAVMRVDDPLPDESGAPGNPGVLSWVELIFSRDVLFLAAE